MIHDHLCLSTLCFFQYLATHGQIWFSVSGQCDSHTCIDLMLDQESLRVPKRRTLSLFIDLPSLESNLDLGSHYIRILSLPHDSAIIDPQSEINPAPQQHWLGQWMNPLPWGPSTSIVNNTNRVLYIYQAIIIARKSLCEWGLASGLFV